MPVKLKEIGAVVEKKELVGNENELAYQSAWNGCRKAQGEISIGFNRERLAEVIYYKTMKDDGGICEPWNEIHEDFRKLFYSDADAIIAEEKSILEVVKNG